MSAFTCAGRSMPQPDHAPPEGYVGCYVAGHKCQAETIRTERDGFVEVVSRCACCGTPYGSMGYPTEWESDGWAPPDLPSATDPWSTR